MLGEIESDVKARMQKNIEALSREFLKVRGGRAHPSLLDHVKVTYYGAPTPLAQVASVVAEDARTLALTPWEKSLVPEIEKAIVAANLGLNPVSAGGVVRIPMPPLTEERRKEMVKVVRREAENAKVAVRNARRDANQQTKELLKDKDITEDESRRFEVINQKLTDDFIAEIDKLLADKERDLTEI